jgi:hypothetical protein
MAGEYVRDQLDLTIAEQAPAGSYALYVGMYHPGTGERLSVRDDTGEIVGDSILLGSIQVEKP